MDPLITVIAKISIDSGLEKTVLEFFLNIVICVV